MYTESNRRYAARRADGELLRRMTGGELSGNGFPVMNLSPTGGEPLAPMRDLRPRTSCNGGTGNVGGTGACTHACEQDTFAPSLAMVYSPRQCWRELLSPADGLSAGSLFSELVLPLETVPHHGSKEVKIRRPMM